MFGYMCSCFPSYVQPVHLAMSVQISMIPLPKQRVILAITVLAYRLPVHSAQLGLPARHHLVTS